MALDREQIAVLHSEAAGIFETILLLLSTETFPTAHRIAHPLEISDPLGQHPRQGETFEMTETTETEVMAHHLQLETFAAQTSHHFHVTGAIQCHSIVSHLSVPDREMLRFATPSHHFATDPKGMVSF